MTPPRHHRHLFDPGLQPERTALAWRRTVLTIAVGAVVALRILPSSLGSSAAVWVVGVGAATAAWIWAIRRGRRTLEVLVSGQGVLPDGTLPLVLSISVSLGAAVGLAYVARA